jgi:5-formyltetrahydrofolate cyclo-ligase
VQSAQKAALRAALIAGRYARSEHAVASARTAIRTAVLARCDEQGWRCVAAYVPLRGEPGSVELLDELVGRGIRVLVPMLLADRELDWVCWRPSGPPASGAASLGVGAVGDADAVLVPALAVARDGTRLGRGGGSYDRALTRVRPAAAVAALLYDDEVTDALPRDEWDVAVTAVATPSGWTELARGRR